MRIFTILTFLVVLSLNINAQTTGSFQESVTFNEADYNATRTLYYHVPSDYDASQSYPLVVGFRGGPHNNAGQFRDQLTFLADSIGAIILCPENSAHFWNEEGLTKQLFQYSVAHIQAAYNIDETRIYLTGLSYGGRHAVIVAMDTDAGPIPNIRGVIPFATGSEGDLQPNYDAVDDFPPACVCIGLNDSQNFINVANNLHNDLTTNGAASLLNEITGVGHTVAFSTYPAEMMECLDFIESQYSPTTVEHVFAPIAIRLFPNPAQDQLVLTYREGADVEGILVTDPQGRQLLQIPLGSTVVDISHLPKGVYLLVVTTSTGQQTQRFIKS